MDERPAPMDNVRMVTRRRLLKLSAAGALGVGAASLLGAAGASAANETVFAAPMLQASKITFLVNSGDGDRIRNVSAAYTASTGTAVEVLELPYDQSFQKLQIALSQKTDAYDLASLDDPWIPQFAGNKFLVNLDEMYSKAGTQPSPDFQPQLLVSATGPKARDCERCRGSATCRCLPGAMTWSTTGPTPGTR